jgi:hypothetical protein
MLELPTLTAATCWSRTAALLLEQADADRVSWQEPLVYEAGLDLGAMD